MSKWEPIDSITDRLKVPGGWLVRSSLIGLQGRAIHQIFIADVNHSWVIQ